MLSACRKWKIRGTNNLAAHMNMWTFTCEIFPPLFDKRNEFWKNHKISSDLLNHAEHSDVASKTEFGIEINKFSWSTFYLIASYIQYIVFFCGMKYLFKKHESLILYIHWKWYMYRKNIFLLILRRFDSFDCRKVWMS